MSQSLIAAQAAVLAAEEHYKAVTAVEFPTPTSLDDLFEEMDNPTPTSPEWHAAFAAYSAAQALVHAAQVAENLTATREGREAHDAFKMSWS